MSNNTVIAISIICSTIFNLALVAVAVGLSLYTNNFKFLWLLVLPIALTDVIKFKKENKEIENE